MKLLLKRTYKKDNYTIGNLYINNKWFCSTLECPDRGLNDNHFNSYIQSIKQKGKTAIPTGTYDITLDEISPKYSKKEKYKPIEGKLPRLLDVPGFDGILIHCGNSVNDTEGCILVGKNKLKGRVCESTDTFFRLYKLLQKAKEKNKDIKITIE